MATRWKGRLLDAAPKAGRPTARWSCTSCSPADSWGADRQTEAELAHWQLAVEALADLDTVAAPEAWAALEDYLRRRVRDRLSEVVAVLVAEGRGLRRLLASGGEPGEVRRAVLGLRTRYLQVETILDFYGHAVNSRTNPTLRALLRGYDALAGDSMAAILTRLSIDPPPALVYLDRGLGAAILRAGVRLWDHSHPSPTAAIKLTRHNLPYPTALLHETGHQVAHLTGWVAVPWRCPSPRGTAMPPTSPSGTESRPPASSGPTIW